MKNTILNNTMPILYNVLLATPCVLSLAKRVDMPGLPLFVLSEEVNHPVDSFQSPHFA
jgi:hypothetical protein